MSALPSWMYGNPMLAVERMQNIEAARARKIAERQAGRDFATAPSREGHAAGLAAAAFTAATRRLINQARIRRLTAKVMRGY